MSDWTPPPNGSMPPFPSEGHEERTTAWRLAVISIALTMTGELVFLGLDFQIIDSPLVLVLRSIHVALGAGLLVWLFRRQRRPRRHQSVIAFLAIGIPLAPIFWLAEQGLLDSGRPWSPFVGEKLTMLAVAMLAPGELWVGAVVIILLAIEAVAFWFAYDLTLLPQQVAAGEPWITLFHVLLAFGLLAYRARQQRLSRDFSRARADAAALERLARVAIAVRDAANTPLQTLEVSSSLLETHHPDARRIGERISRAVARLKQLTQLLAGYERSEWHHGDESFDAEERLRQISKPQVNRTN